MHTKACPHECHLCDKKIKKQLGLTPDTAFEIRCPTCNRLTRIDFEGMRCVPCGLIIPCVIENNCWYKVFGHDNNEYIVLRGTGYWCTTTSILVK